MTERQKNVLIWVVLIALLLVQLYLEMQEDGAVKFIGRFTCLLVLIYRIQGLKRGMRS